MGGFSLGMQMAGVEPAVGVDSWGVAVDVYKKNFPKAEGIVADVSSRTFQREFVDKWKGKAFVVVGGPPCQSFSMMNQKTRIGSDLPIVFARLACRLEPEFVIMEEVPTMKKMTNSTIKDAIIRIFTRHKYSVWDGILNAADFCVPQTRRRYIIVAYRNTEYSPPVPLIDSHLPAKTVLRGLKGRPLTKYAIQKILEKESNRTNRYHTYTVMDMEKPSPTLTTHFTQPDAWCALKVRGTYYSLLTLHGLLLQSFPPVYDMKDVPIAHRKKLIGNAMPPLFSKALIDSLEKI